MAGGIGDETGEGDLRGPLRRMLSERYAHYRRVAEILAAISRYGFGRVGDAASSLRELHVDAEVDRSVAAFGAPERFRLLLERLGPTFIKLGQMLSTRSDLISEEFAAELGRLRDSAPPIPIADVRKVVTAELGVPPEEAFASFDPEPVAAASIGQVHRATLKGTGEALAVKVQRPGVQEVLRVDMEVLRDLAGTLERLFRDIERFDPRGAIDEFDRMLMREVDYTVEARNIERFRANMASVEGVVIPRVHWGLSSRRVLTMDFLAGTSLDDAAAIGRAGVDPKRLTRVIGDAYVKQIFVDGFFHADPHQGNLLLMEGGRVGLLDFGAIGYLDAVAREHATDLYVAIIRGDPDRAAAAFVELAGGSAKGVDMAAFELGLQDFIDYNSLKRARVEMDRGMNQRLVAIALRAGLRPPSSFVLLERALMEVEGVCRGLDPSFDVIELARANMGALLRERYAPDLDPLQALDTAQGYRRLARELPGRLDKVLKKVEEDDLTIKLDRAYLDELRASIRRSALIVAASLMAVSMIFYVAYEGPTLHLEAVHITLSVPIIILVWALVVWRISRRG